MTTVFCPSGPVTLRLIVCRSSFQARATSGGSRSVVMPGDRASILAQNRPARDRGDRVQAGVVECGLPFLQVVHEQVADRLALQPVAVDEFLDGQLSLGHAERADRGRGVGGEDPEGVQAEVEVDLLLAAAGVDQPLGVGHLHAVPDGDVADDAALAGQDGRDPGVREPGVLPVPTPARIPPARAAGRTRRRRDFRHDRGQVPVGPGHHPGHAGGITSPQMSISSPDDRSFSS